MKQIGFLAGLAAILFFYNCSKVKVYPEGKIEVVDAWVSQVPESSETTAAYFTLVNHSELDDALVGAKSDLAENLEIHEMVTEDGRTGMRYKELLPIGSGESVELKPGGIHLMFIGLTRPVSKDNKVTVILTFEKSGDLEVVMNVKAPHEYYKED